MNRRTALVLALALLLGLLAVPATAASATPEAALAGITQMDAGNDHTCARLNTGQARCWGYNLYRQLGDNSIINRWLPTPVLNTTGTGPLTNVARVDAGGNHSCALLVSRQLRCWGNNIDGELGAGDQAAKNFPVAVVGVGAAPRLTGVRSVSAGYNHTCALVTGGQVRCWGGNFERQLGDNTVALRSRPVVVLDLDGVGPLTGVTQISAGGSVTCARLNTGRVACWGNNNNNQLGDGTITDRGLPTLVSSPSGIGSLGNVASVHVGASHACVRLTTGQARCWGNGHLGNNAASQESRPVGVLNSAGTAAQTGILQLATGTNHTCIRLAQGRTRCWGYNASYQIGDRTATNRLLPVATSNPAGTTGLSGVAFLSPGGSHSCFLLTNGQALCGGGNGQGQLGDGTVATRDRPIGVRR